MPTEVHDYPAKALHPKITVLVHRFSHRTEVEPFAVGLDSYPSIGERVIKPCHHPTLMPEFVLRHQPGKVRMVKDAAHNFLEP